MLSFVATLEPVDPVQGDPVRKNQRKPHHPRRLTKPYACPGVLSMSQESSLQMEPHSNVWALNI